MLEVAWAVARAGARADPPVPPPPALRPVLRLSRLPRTALGQVRRAVDDDPGLRERVAALVEDEADVGRAGWLWLHRPEGWEAELDALTAEAEAAARAAEDEKAERSAQRRLAKVEAAAERAREAAEKARREAAEARAALDAERRVRRDVEAEAAQLQERSARSDAERQRAVARADEAEVAAGELRREAAELRQRIDELERRMRHALDREALSRAVSDAAGAVARAAELLEAPPEEVERRPRPARPAGPRREAARLPGGMFDDTPEAAEHLVRIDDMTILVDGYNVSKTAWPGLALDEQRRRLLDALAELALRAGARPHVVFDGAAELPGSTRRPSHPVQVTFSPEGVTADDVLLDLVDAHPLGRPVVVASNDREVRDGARARGANTISSQQLLAVVGRYGLDP